MRKYLCAAFVICLFTSARVGWGGAGISPEQIYQPAVDWSMVVGTWEILPDDNPLSENHERGPQPKVRTIMTLRKDGTCRMFDKKHPAGADSLWTYEHHEMFIRFPDGSSVGLFVYGVRGDYMVTRSPIKAGKDQLWSRVK
jgi:hypothetical protein